MRQHKVPAALWAETRARATRGSNMKDVLLKGITVDRIAFWLGAVIGCGVVVFAIWAAIVR